MSTLSRALGIGRSLAMYYGVPLRARRMRRFYGQFVPRGGLCFDVGAHAGNRVRCFRQLGARVVAIEPQPDFVRLLERFYGRDADVTIVPVALGRTEGSAEIFVSERTPTVTTLSRDWLADVKRSPSFAGVEWQSGGRVPLTTIEALIARYGEPDFVKVDVEGYEAEVLGGLTTAVRALSFEFLPASRQAALDCIERLAELGRYRYNWSLGESLTLVSDHWFDAVDMRGVLASMPATAPSGDVYAVRDNA